MNPFSRYIVLAVALGVLVACGDKKEQGSNNALADKMPKIEFVDNVKEVDFGSMIEGDTVQRAFKFTNSGEFPLIINNVSTSCGCTVPQWPREPIAPGEGSQILVRFNSKGKRGPQFKTVSIYANTDLAVSEIKFKAEVNARMIQVLKNKT